MSFTNSARFEMLNKSNYDTWKIQVEALLIKNDTWSYVSGEKPKPQITGEGEARAVMEEEQKKWIAADRKAKSDLILAMNASELRQIRSCETSREIWMKLESIYESKGPARKATLLKQLTQHKMREDDDVREHVARFMDTVDKLQGMNIEINGDLLSIMSLYSLPSSFENFQCAIESRDSSPNVENLKVKIVEENDARNQKLDGSLTGGVMFSKHFSRDSNSSKNSYKKQDEKTSKPKITYKCNYCGRRGHKAADCFKKKREENQKAGLVHEAYFSGKTNDKWCLDSGCTSHICNDKELFIDSQKAQCQLKLASNATTQAIAKGNVNILTSVGNQAKKIELKNTLYAPDFRTNLLSIAKIVDKNREVLFTKNRAFIQDRRGRVKMIADRDGDLFYLRENHQKACATSVTMACDIFNNWHRRFGHLNFKDLEVMMKENLVAGAKLKGAVSTKNPCKICISGKFATAPFPRRPNRSSNLLDIVHTDVCGPMRIESKGGARYFVTLEWKDAILSEIKSLVINDTWDVVDKPDHAKVVGCRTVLRNKYAANGTLDRRKARVVTKGFTQRPGIDFHDTFAPVAPLSSLRLLVALAAKYNLKISQLDVTSAYLNGKIDTEVFMEKPALLKEMLQRIIDEEEDDHTLVKKARVMLRDLQGENKICRLRKALYGLRQAGRQWNYEIDKTMKRAGLVPTNADPCVYVDKNTRTFLSKTFRIKDFGLAKYCLGTQIEQSENEICLSQAGYIREILKRYRMEDCKLVLTPLAVGSKLSELHSEDDNEDTNFPFKELIGALMYVAVGTRPDVSHV
jgi:hypothetical protein